MLGISTILSLQEKNIDILGVLTITMAYVFICSVPESIKAVSHHIERSYKFFNTLYYVFWFRVFRATQPDVLNVFLKSFAEAISAFEEAQKQIDDVEYAMLNSKIENLQLRDKVTQLKKNLEILAEEFQGNDFIDIEFSAWIRASRTIDTLIKDRLAHLDLICRLRFDYEQSQYYIKSLESDKEDMKRQIKSLQVILTSTEPSEIRKSQEKSAKPTTTETEIKKLQAELQNQIKRNNETDKILAQKNNELNNLKQRIAKLDIEKDKLAQENKNLSSKQDELNNLKERITKLKREKDKLAQENRTLSSEQASIVQSHEARKKDLEKEKDRLSDQLQVLQAKISSTQKYEEELEDEKQRYKDLEDNIYKIRQNYKKLKSTNKELCVKIQKLKKYRDRPIKHKPGYNNNIRDRLKKSRRRRSQSWDK